MGVMTNLCYHLTKNRYNIVETSLKFPNIGTKINFTRMAKKTGNPDRLIFVSILAYYHLK